MKKRTKLSRGLCRWRGCKKKFISAGLCLAHYLEMSDHVREVTSRSRLRFGGKPERRKCNHWSPVGYGGSQQCTKKVGHKGKHIAPMGLGLAIEWESDWKRCQID